MKFEVKNRWTGDVQFTAEISANKDAPRSVKMGLAVRWGLKNSAILRDADLSGADLSGAILRDADLRGAPFKIENIHSKIFIAASKLGALDMGQWHHPCGTTHCRAGWAVALAGDAGKTLEWSHGTSAAATLIYLASDPKLQKVPDFYCDNETALADMKRLAELESARANQPLPETPEGKE